MLKRLDIRVRDPYIVFEDGVYYLYATTGETTMSYYTSTDMENWEAGGPAFVIPKGFWAYKDVWASEVHKYKGRFYLFVSLLGKNGLRGTQIAVADTPAGPFLPLVDHAVTPAAQSCIDGTLYVEDGTPYIVYSHDWPDNFVPEKNAYVGELWAAQLREDLTEIVGEPWLLFASDESPISKKTPDHTEWEGKPAIRYGSDAPFLQKLSNGTLLLTWSPYLNDNYVVLSVVSKSGSLKGPWEHLSVPLFDKNGGHAMFFRNGEDKLCMCIHAPEAPMLERAHIFEAVEENGTLVLKNEIGGRPKQENNTMKLMSFNTQHCLNYLERKIDFPLMAKTILNSGAEVVGLNEMRDEGPREDYGPQTAILSELTGMAHAYFAKAIDVDGCNPYGNAILSRIPFKSVETIPIPDPERRPGGKYYETRCLLKAKLVNGLTVLVTHFGLNPEEQENAVSTVLANLEEEKCVLMGDFNVLPEDPVLLPIRERMTDTAAFFAGERRSFPSDAPERKIDYIFVSRDMAVEAADIPAVVASDHRPHTAEITFAE